MQFRVIIAFFIFLGSYLPLSLILLAQNFDYSAFGRPFCPAFWTKGCSLPFQNAGWAIGIFVVCLICFAVTLAALAVIKPDRPIIISSATHIPADLMNYTLPYVVSFMSIDYQDTGKFVGFVIFLAWMFWITHRSGQIIMNPALIAFGWRPYEVAYTFEGNTREYTQLALVRGYLSTGERHLEMAVQDVLVIKPTGLQR